MTARFASPLTFLAVLTLAASCGSLKGLDTSSKVDENDTIVLAGEGREAHDNKTTIWDIFDSAPEQEVQVNRYLWNASLDVLSFLPVQSVDPFTGVIITGYGTPPGGSRAYRATVHIKDPALDARSLNVALQSKGGPVDASTARAVEDAILSRARQLRIADKKL